MLPTLNGRIQTRIFMLVVFGGLITLAITPVLPHDPDYRTTFLVLATVLVLGILWELVYHLIQQFRWEKDWPTMLALLTGITEGALVWLVLELGLVPGIDDPMPLSTFVVMFGIVWVVIWLWIAGPMRVPLIHWRFFGGRVV
jgi:hypothetical protein